MFCKLCRRTALAEKEDRRRVIEKKPPNCHQLGTDVEAPWGENIETSRKYECQIIRLGCPAAGCGGMYFICIFASKRTRPTPFSTELHLKALTTLPKTNYFASCSGKSERSALTFVKTRENMKKICSNPPVQAQEKPVAAAAGLRRRGRADGFLVAR